MKRVNKAKQQAEEISVQLVHADSDDPKIQTPSQNPKMIAILQAGRQQKGFVLSPAEMERWLEEECDE